jgi:hypothetical protein
MPSVEPPPSPQPDVNSSPPHASTQHDPATNDQLQVPSAATNNILPSPTTTNLLADPQPTPEPPQAASPNPPPDNESHPGRSTTPTFDDLRYGFTPVQKQSILCTLAKIRKRLDEMGLEDRPILFTDLAPIGSTSRRESSVLAAQLLGMISFY